jgi:hypothetical protein
MKTNNIITVTDEELELLRSIMDKQEVGTSLQRAINCAQAERNTKYNGWTNYPTWRVNLELIDGGDYYEEMAYEYIRGNGENIEAYDFGKLIEESIDSQVAEYPDSFVKDYCDSWLSEVNWYEIAEHIIMDLDQDKIDEILNSDEDEGEN